MGRLVDLALSYAELIDLPLECAYDLGCGTGLWREALVQRLPELEYTGVEVSAYQVERHGWIQASVADFTPRAFGLPAQADLVICQGVLQYLEDKEAKRAIENLAALTGELLYLEALTRTDWAERCDREHTDGSVHLRSVSWYRRLLAPHFVPLGMGFFLPRHHGRVFFQLEEVDWPRAR